MLNTFKNFKKRANRGFTIVEVVVVIVIIGVLTAIAVPAYTSYINRAREAETVYALKTLADKQELRFLDSGAFLPTPLIPAAVPVAPVQVNFGSATVTPPVVAGNVAYAQLGFSIDDDVRYSLQCLAPAPAVGALATYTCGGAANFDGDLINYWMIRTGSIGPNGDFITGQANFTGFAPDGSTPSGARYE